MRKDRSVPWILKYRQRKFRSRKMLKTEEMSSLYNELLKCKVSNLCPNGKSIIKNFKIDDLKKYF